MRALLRRVLKDVGTRNDVEHSNNMALRHTIMLKSVDYVYVLMYREGYTQEIQLLTQNWPKKRRRYR